MTNQFEVTGTGFLRLNSVLAPRDLLQDPDDLCAASICGDRRIDDLRRELDRHLSSSMRSGQGGHIAS
jgi:hypothetical protein